MKKFYKELVEELKNSGELSPTSRKKVWDKFESIYGDETGRRKRLELELNALKKIQESWETCTPISKELMKQTEDVLASFLHERQEEIEKRAKRFYKKCDAEKSGDENVYLYYLKQAVVYLEISLDDTLSEEEDEDVPLENGELEVDEYDTSYCASLMWKYQDMETDEITRKRRQIEFWEWYIKEAAALLDDPMKENIKIASCMPDAPSLQITDAQDFVRAISSEQDYVKYEKRDEKKVLRIYVCEHKKGATCPKCETFSERIRISLPVRDKLGKFKDWAVEFINELDYFYCDKENCPEEDFPARTKVGLTEKKANFRYITKQKENEEIIRKLFDL